MGSSTRVGAVDDGLSDVDRVVATVIHDGRFVGEFLGDPEAAARSVGVRVDAVLARELTSLPPALLLRRTLAKVSRASAKARAQVVDRSPTQPMAAVVIVVIVVVVLVFVPTPTCRRGVPLVRDESPDADSKI
ncbi:MAG: hypothetical protein H6825_11380 [Planctomycetes bacterium]|nr:hypothetical protein [Planctomycetota bacterium]